MSVLFMNGASHFQVSVVNIFNQSRYVCLAHHQYLKTGFEVAIQHGSELATQLKLEFHILA